MFEIRGAFVSGDAPTPPWQSYLNVAGSLLPGMRALDEADPNNYAAHALLACHTLECILKAHLARTNSASLIQAHDVRHNLEELWGLCAREGLAIPNVPPLWVQQLGFLHDKPYYLRYAPGVAGVSTPNPEPARSELGSLLALVERTAS